jgi:hypothetical protein
MPTAKKPAATADAAPREGRYSVSRRGIGGRPALPDEQKRKTISPLVAPEVYSLIFEHLVGDGKPYKSVGAATDDAFAALAKSLKIKLEKPKKK